MLNLLLFLDLMQKKTQNKNSDLDICVITNTKITSNQKDKILYYKDKKLDIYIFDELSLPLQFKIITQGTIYNSKIDTTEIKNRTTNKWFDFKPILNRIYKSKKLLPIT